MASLSLGNKSIALDQHGHLLTASDWNDAVAHALAHSINIQLTEQHWEIIYFLRDFQQQYHDIPIMRLLLKAMRQTLAVDKANSVYLNVLFPGGFLKQACKVAGLAKPKHCM